MKSMLLVLIAAGSAIFGSAQAQFGVKAGVNIADLNLSGGPSGFGFNTKTDFNGLSLANHFLRLVFTSIEMPAEK